MVKACDIFKTKNYYKIITQSESETGLLLIDRPIFIVPLDVKIEELKEKIFNALNSSRINVKMPNSKEEVAKWQKEQLKDLEEKSFSNLYKNSSNCGIKLTNDIIKITPSKYSEKYKRYDQCKRRYI